MVSRVRALILLAVLLAGGNASAQNFVEGQHYWFEPAVFPGKTLPGGHPYGAGKARGAVIWNDGYSPDKIAPEKVPPVMQAFAEAGWDVFNLRRHSLIGLGRGGTGATDLTATIITLGIDRLKERGYRDVVLSGQSRGAYASIQVGSYGVEIHGILPLSPAGFGDYTRGPSWVNNDLEIRAMWEKYAGKPIHVAAGFFSGDDWFETKHPNVRGPFAVKRLTELGVANFIVSEPTYAGMSGHGGGGSWQFARRFGPCLVQFFDTGKSPSCADTDPATPATFRLKPPAIPASDGNAFTGQWQGTIATGRFAVLTIPPAGTDPFNAHYQLAAAVNGDKASNTTWKLQRREDRLVTEIGKFEFRIHAPDANVLRITSVNHGAGQADELEFASLIKVTAR